ncbi:MAG: hypothetical protein AAFX02_10185 [Pseudomonadota bacterium]
MGKIVTKSFVCGTIASVLSIALAEATYAQSAAQRAEAAPAPRAIQCAAALELMARAAPSWSAQEAAIDARKVWNQEADILSRVMGRSARKQINQEMNLLAEATVEQPDILSSMALSCVADAPTPVSY